MDDLNPDYLSISTNLVVRDLYSYILYNQNNDSDYWDHASIDFKLNNFQEHDWEALTIDLKFWSTFQLEIFTYCLMTSYTYNLPSGEYKEDRHFFDELKKTLPPKVDLILPLMKIGMDRGRLKNDILLTIGEEDYFLVNHFKVLLDYDINYLNVIKKIVSILGWCSEELQLLIDEAERGV